MSQTPLVTNRSGNVKMLSCQPVESNKKQFIICDPYGSASLFVAKPLIMWKSVKFNAVKSYSVKLFHVTIINAAQETYLFSKTIDAVRICLSGARKSCMALLQKRTSSRVIILSIFVSKLVLL